MTCSTATTATPVCCCRYCSTTDVSMLTVAGRVQRAPHLFDTAKEHATKCVAEQPYLLYPVPRTQHHTVLLSRAVQHLPAPPFHAAPVPCTSWYKHCSNTSCEKDCLAMHHMLTRHQTAQFFVTLLQITYKQHIKQLANRMPFEQCKACVTAMQRSFPSSADCCQP